MIRCVVLASGSGTKLQSLLDSIFFGEIPGLEIVAVISSDPDANALNRARNGGIDASVIHPEVFPRIIGVQPSLVPAFQELRGLAVHEAVLARGLKLTGATAFLFDEQGGIGPILLQKAVEVREDDDAVSLQRRVLRQAEWSILPDAAKLWCAGAFEVHAGRAKRIK